MAERVWLDPVEVSTGRTELEITAWIDANEGVDWGDAEIAAYMADMERGSAPVDFRIPSRQVSIPLVIKATPGTTFQQARLNLQRKVALLQREGGWIKRLLSSQTTPVGGVVYADVVNASLKLGGSWMSVHKNVDLDALLTLECIPDWYRDEVQLADHIDTTAGEVIWTETNIAGDYPGRVRLVVDNDGTTNINGLIWGVRSRHYSNATTARLVYEAETCTPLDTATVAGGLIVHQSVSSGWTPVLSTNQTGGVALTHTGTYQVWCRAGGVLMLPTDTQPPSQLRLTWDVGDFSLPSENGPVEIPNTGAYHILPLGQVRLDRVPAGSHRWQGVVQARNSLGQKQVQIDKLWFVPVDEGYGVLRAPLTVEPGLQGYSVRDEFNQSAGVVTGKTAAAGGAWSGAGDTDDFTVNATPHELWRSAVSDANADTGRYVFLGGTSFTAVVVQADIWGGAQADRRCVLARYTDINNWVRAGFRAGNALVFEGKRAGVALNGASAGFTIGNAFYTVRLYVDTVGNVVVWAFPNAGAPGDPQIVASESALATGGGLASGFVGIYDAWTAATGSTRAYDNLKAWVPSPDAVLFPGRSGEFRTEGMLRQDPTGVAYGPVSYVTGDLPRVPPAGLEARTVQFFVKASPGELDLLPDRANVNSSARLTYRPSHLFVA